jgi:hypothetical protein
MYRKRPTKNQLERKLNSDYFISSVDDLLTNFSYISVLSDRDKVAKNKHRVGSVIRLHDPTLFQKLYYEELENRGFSKE